MSASGVEITCTACGADAILVRTPLYDNFKKTGEVLSCSECKHVFAKEAEVVFKDRKAPRVFDESDKPGKLTVFRDDEKGRLCRYCLHYVVNPFTQKCARTLGTVEATDSCEHFTPVKKDASLSG